MQGTIPATCMLLCAAAVASGCDVGAASSADAAPPPPLPVDGVSAVVTDLHASYDATTTLLADGEARVPARTGGQVVDILVEEGDLVEAGQLLARLDGERPRLAMLEARAELARVQNEYERQQTLHSRGIVSAAAFDTLTYEVESLDAAWRLKQLDFSYADIRAPIAGVVASREISLGQQLEAGDVAFRLSDRSRLVAEIRVPQTELHRFHAGLPVRLTVDALEHSSFAAVVDRISPTIDTATGTFRVTAYIDNAAGALAPGMFARVSVAYATYENALAVPAVALVEEDGRFVVYVVKDGQAERRLVELGARERGLVQILDGISEGETVIRDAGGVRDGARVVAAVSGSAAAGA